jgi:hypothetical protein
MMSQTYFFDTGQAVAFIRQLAELGHSSIFSNTLFVRSEGIGHG